MRHLNGDKGRAEILLERGKTIAIVGPTTTERHQATLKYLSGVGYDLVWVRGVTLTDVPGTIDLVLVFGAPGDLQRLLEEAAAKRVDGVWFLQQGPGRLARDPARRLGLTLIVDSDVVRRHRGRLGR
jgi:predicted CoA-binding protein